MTSNCVFCKIICNEAPAEIYYQDNEIIIIKDIKPASKIHILAISKEHIPNINSLTTKHKPLLEKMCLEGKRVVEEKGGLLNDLLLGFHKPPFNSVSHLHLHLISPKSEMSFLSSAVYSSTWPWFTEFDKVMSRL